MILSMTGFGKASVSFLNNKITAEIKSLNSKQLDLSARIPLSYRELELQLRNEVAKVLLRGKVDLTVMVESTTGSEQITLNLPLLQEYKQKIEQMAEALNLPEPKDWYNTLLRLPNVLKADVVTELTDEEKECVLKAVLEATDALVEFRRQEGARLDTFFREKIANIRALLAEVQAYEETRVPKIKLRIEEALSKLDNVVYDKNRFEQEMIFYIEKLDVSEEKLRLTNHLDYFLTTLSGEIGQGKKLGFIAQEMGREINTLGSKSNQAEMQNLVVRMKDELEQIKEQVLNVL